MLSYRKFPNLIHIVRKIIGFEKLLTLIGISAIKAQRILYPSITDLRQSELSVFSQNGEDGILDFLLERCGIQKPNIIEIGAGNFRECNSRFCNIVRNSNLYLVDKQLDDLILKRYYLTRMINSNIIFDNSWVTKDNINSILQKARKNLDELNVLSIDIDGNDFWILSAITKLDFDILILEYNPSLSLSEPVSTLYKSNFNRVDEHYSFKYYGASLEAFVHYLRKKQYFFVGATSQGTNAFFVKNAYLDKFSNWNKTIELYKNTSSREARDLNGSLSFLTSRQERDILSTKYVINTETEEVKTILETY